jgi:predicted AlkP superfamily pyrophosphatase or phosphodiesterase
MMKSPIGVRRIVLVVLDGFRPETLADNRLSHIDQLASNGAATRCAGFGLGMGRAPRFRDGLERLTVELGIAGTRFVGRDSEFCLYVAQATLVMQRRGLILMHWPDAERAANDYGYGSGRYRAAAKEIDDALASLAAQILIPRDPSTLLVVASDHVRAMDDQPLHAVSNERELLLIAGGAVVNAPLPETVSILDVAPTIRWVLGIGDGATPGVLHQAFRPHRESSLTDAREQRESASPM